MATKAPVKKATPVRAKLVGLVVTTKHKGVFFGKAVKPDAKKEITQIELKQAQMCIYWDNSIRGVVGLAATGPNGQCKIGPAAPSVILTDVTSVMEASPEAVAAWAVAGERKWA